MSLPSGRIPLPRPSSCSREFDRSTYCQEGATGHDSLAGSHQVEGSCSGEIPTLTTDVRGIENTLSVCEITQNNLGFVWYCSNPMNLTNAGSPRM